jgi:hypothetical protein
VVVVSQVLYPLGAGAAEQGRGGGWAAAAGAAAEEVLIVSSTLYRRPLLPSPGHEAGAGQLPEEAEEGVGAWEGVRRGGGPPGQRRSALGLLPRGERGPQGGQQAAAAPAAAAEAAPAQTAGLGAARGGPSRRRVLALVPWTGHQRPGAEAPAAPAPTRASRQGAPWQQSLSRKLLVLLGKQQQEEQQGGHEGGSSPAWQIPAARPGGEAVEKALEPAAAGSRGAQQGV